MARKLNLIQNFPAIIENFLEGNPQLFREIKGKFKPRNIAIAVLVSLLSQALILGYFQESLRVDGNLSIYNRYCIQETIYTFNDYRNQCLLDSSGNLVINWQLWWLDVFIATSVIAMIALLVVGTYMLIADLAQEEQRGTLNLLRLSPQTASNIAIGKILGVPSLLYLAILVTLPLHFLAGIKVHIPLSLIVSFDLVLAFGCAFFYSAALLLGIVKTGLAGFKPWLTSGGIFLFLSIVKENTLSSYSSPSHTPFDWLSLFFPGRVLTYLIQAADLSTSSLNYSYSPEINDLLFYGQSLWTKSGTGIAFILVNYAIWTYWLWQGWQRRFHNPTRTIFSKQQSYWITISFVILVLGFTLQTTDTHQLWHNYIWLQGFLLLLFLGLIAALSPHRQALSDWARYRHQQKQKNRSLWKDLLLGEISPATVAIALNILIATVYILPSISIFSLAENSVSIFWSLLLAGNTIFIYALIAQSILFMKGEKRVIWATGSVLSLTILPLVGLEILGIEPASVPHFWLFTFEPILATKYVTTSTLIMSLLGQWLAIALVGFHLNRQLRQAGASETIAVPTKIRTSH
jgi:hypothetical protein